MSSLEYWKEREETARQHYLTEEANIQKELQKKYTYLQSEIEKEINGFYQKYATSTGITMADAMQAVSKMDVQAFQEKAKKYVKTRDFSDKANAELKLDNATMKINRLELLKANIGLEMIDTFNDQEKLLDDAFYNRAIDEFERQAGILGMGVSDAPKSARQIVNASFQNAKFSDRIWLYQGQLKNELSSLLLNGIVQGTHSRVLARHIEKVFGATRSNSERLMRTEMARIQTAVQEESFKKNGFDQYVFLALGTACGICRAINGQHFPVNKMQPGENAPPMHPNCRCSTAAWMDTEKYNAWLDSGAEVSFKEYSKEASNDIANTKRLGIIKGTRKQLRMNLQFFAEKAIKNQSSNSLKKAIKTLREHVAEHEQKIENPKAFYPKWNTYDERQKEGFKKHWKKEIQNFQQSIQNRIDELKARGDYDE